MGRGRSYRTGGLELSVARDTGAGVSGYLKAVQSVVMSRTFFSTSTCRVG